MERISEESCSEFKDDEARLAKMDAYVIYYHAREVSKITLDLQGSGQRIEKDIKVSSIKEFWFREVQSAGANESFVISRRLLTFGKKRWKGWRSKRSRI